MTANLTYILVMGLICLAIRVLPIVLIRKQIENIHIRSFLYYVPYVTLAVMTFPAILEATGSTIAGILAFAAGILAAWFGVSMYKVAILCVAIVFVAGFLF